jgi:hypothetical protein
MFDVSLAFNGTSDNQLTYLNIQADPTYRAEKFGGIWRLINRREESGDDEEVVASFQGILCKIDLPPFNEKNM